MRGSEDPNENNKNDEKAENNNIYENNNKTAECNGMRHKRVQRPETWKKSLSAMIRRMIGCKFYSKNDKKHDFDKKKLQKFVECMQ